MRNVILTQEGLKEAGLKDADDTLDGRSQLLVLRGCQLGVVLLQQLQRPVGFCANKAKRKKKVKNQWITKFSRTPLERVPRLF